MFTRLTPSVPGFVYSGDDGTVVLRDDDITVDLVSLDNSAELLVDVDVPTGTYHQLRFVIDDAWIEIENDDSELEVYATPGFVAEPGVEVTGELKTPSWSSSGLKLQFADGALVVAGDQHVLLVDFDVAESLSHQTGNGAWVMSPVVKVQPIELTTTIDVRVDLGIDVTFPGPVYIELVDADGFAEGSLLLVDDDGDGVFEASFVYVDPAEGPFQARIVTADGIVLSTDPGVVIIEGVSGAVVSADVVVTAD